MGNSIDKEVHKSFTERYKYKKVIEDDRYGRLLIYKDMEEEKEYVALKEKMANNQANYLELRNKIFKRSQVKNKFKGDIVFKYDRKFEDMCSTHYKFYIYHEWFEKTLQSHIITQKQ